jgi:hypothetical protein
MFGTARRRREREEFAMLHAKIAAIHGDVIRRDEELIAVLDRLTAVTADMDDRLAITAPVIEGLRRAIEGRSPADIDLTGRPRVLGGSVDTGAAELVDRT